MIRLALLGKDIQHSRSQEMYEKILHKKIQYDLIDVDDKSKLPGIDFLREKYLGVSITAPYKHHYLDKVDSLKTPNELQAINCLIFDKSSTVGANTDYLALLKLVPEINTKKLPVKILGDGAMAKVVCFILDKLNLSYIVHSRKSKNLLDIKIDDPHLVINCCAREYFFSGFLSPECIFWDLNYNHIANRTIVEKFTATYIDGINLLYGQAEQSVKLWSVN